MPTGINNIVVPPYVASIQRGYFIVAMVASIIIFISMCLIYEDNDAKCWYLVIPFYNLYTKFKIFWNKNYFYFHLIPFIIAFIAILTAGVVILSIVLSSLGGIGYEDATQIATSASITIAVGLTIGLLLIPVIFYAILGVKCINSGVLSKIPTGRKVFMIICTALLIAFTALPIYYHVI